MYIEKLTENDFNRFAKTLGGTAFKATDTGNGEIEFKIKHKKSCWSDPIYLSDFCVRTNRGEYDGYMRKLNNIYYNFMTNTFGESYQRDWIEVVYTKMKQKFQADNNRNL